VEWIPGAADAPTLDQLLGPPPPAADVPVFRAGVESFDWIRLGWFVLGVLIGYKVLR
jgi:hypothetical protein